ncbi:MAG: hypothetical protein MPF33_05740 [Candidatus Aramenus sp.]|jgi:hypothetical protein|nr:hypothetical protein [Candidatus Aramenus sp.]
MNKLRENLTGYLSGIIVSIVEYYMLFHNSLGPSYSLLPSNVAEKLSYNILNGDAYPGLYGMFSFLLSLLGHVPFLSILAYYLGAYSSFGFLFLGIFFSSIYFLRKYFNAKGPLLYITSNAVSIPVPITWYVVSGVIYFYPGLFAISLALFDYALDVDKVTLRDSVKRGALVALAVTLDFTDPRGILFSLLTFFAYSLYFLTLKRSIRYVVNWFKMFLFGFIFFLLLNVNTILYTRFIAPFVSLVGAATVYNQLGIALQTVNPFYTLVGVMYWLRSSFYVTQFHVNILLGAILTAISFSALLIKRKPIVIFLSIFLLAVASYNYVGSSTLGYWLAQTSRIEYLVYIYPTYLPSYLFVTPFYLLISFSIYSSMSKLVSIRLINWRYIRYLKTIPVVALFLIVALMFYMPIANGFVSTHYSSPPSAVVNSLHEIANNDTGIVLTLGSASLASYYQVLPSVISPSAYGYMNFMWYSITNSLNPAKALAYLGVEYVVFLNDTSSKCFSTISSNPFFKLIYNQSIVKVFYNTLYSPYWSSKGVYVAFNFPLVIDNLSSLNSSYVIIPFYYVNNLQSILPYVKGFIGYNLSPNDLIPMLVNNSAHVISASNIYVNQYYSGGWTHQSPFWTPDVLDAIVSGNPSIPLKLHVPNGNYYVYGLLTLTSLNGLYHSGSIKLVSGNYSILYKMSNLVYNVSWSYLGQLDIVNNSLTLYDDGLNVVKIVLVPASEYEGLYQEAHSLLSNRSIVSFTTQESVIQEGNFSTKGYSTTVFANPWYTFFTFNHEVLVKDPVMSFAYYFEVANVYITSSYPSVSLIYVSDFPYLALNLLVDVAVLFYVTSSKRIWEVIGGSILKSPEKTQERYNPRK